MTIIATVELADDLAARITEHAEALAVAYSAYQAARKHIEASAERDNEIIVWGEMTLQHAQALNALPNSIRHIRATIDFARERERVRAQASRWA